MEQSNLSSHAQWIVSFEGENKIDAYLLGCTALNLSVIVSELSELHSKVFNCSLSISSFQPGSFQTVYDFAMTTYQTIAPYLTIQNAATLINVVKGCFDIKKAIKGEKPALVQKIESEGFVDITSSDGTHIRAPLGSDIVFHNPKIDRSISEIAQAAKISNRAVRFISDNEVVLYNHQDLCDIAAQQHFSSNQVSKSDECRRVHLPIKTLDLLGGSKWSFKDGSRTIEASIVDAVFLNAVHKGINSYKAGDSLDVELETVITYDPDGNVLNEKHQIRHVYGYSSQVSLF